MENNTRFIFPLFFAFFIVLIFSTVPRAQGTDLLPDSHLAEAVSEELGIPVEEITAYNLLDLTELEVSNVNNLAGLLYAENLEKLFLEYLGHFAGLEIVFELEELERISLVNSRLRSNDIDGISELETLKVLRLDGNIIENLPSLEGLDELEILSLKDNEIVEITEINKLRSLKVLDLSDNHIKDLAPLINLDRLDRLDISGNRVTDVSPLLKNEGLQEKDIVYLQNNFLDFPPGSRDHRNVKALKSRGVNVTYFPQRTQKRRVNNSQESN